MDSRERVITGDLLQFARDGRFDIIVHGCNCFCTMGAGIARQIKEQYPGAYEADFETKKGDHRKLGTWTAFVHDDNEECFVIINAYTQYGCNPSRGRNVDYDAVRSCFMHLYNYIHKEGLAEEVRIGYPKIGAGLAGGDWDVISKIIDQELKELDHTLVEYGGK